MKHLVLVILIFIIAGGCKKDPSAINNNPANVPDCLDFSSSCSNILAVQYYDSTQFHSPCVNPNNPNEFIYIYRNYNFPSLSGLYKFSIITKSKTKLTSLGAFPHPKWGKNDWILFTIANGDYREIYRIKSNGDSLTQLTSGHPDLFPEWDNKLNRIIFNRQVYVGSPSSKIMIADFNGGLIDSIENKYFHYGSCNSLSEIAFPPFNLRSCGVSLLNLDSKNESLLIAPEKCLNMNQGTSWHPNNIDIYYTTYYGSLYRINKTTKAQTIIKTFCDTKTYSAISASPDGSFLLVERIDGRLINCAPWYKSSIYMLSLSDATETKIELE